MDFAPARWRSATGGQAMEDMRTAHQDDARCADGALWTLSSAEEKKAR